MKQVIFTAGENAISVKSKYWINFKKNLTWDKCWMKSQLITKVITIHSLWAMNLMTCNHPQLWSGQYRWPANTMWRWGLRSTPSLGPCINHRSLRAPELGRRWPWNAEPESWCSTVKCKVSPHSLTCSECVSAQLNTSRLTVSSCDCLEAPWLHFYFRL